MKMKTELFLAWKYFKPKRSAVSVITLISVVGVGLGVAVLMVVLAVMTGFTDHLKMKLLDTGAHAQIQKRSDYASLYFSNNPQKESLAGRGGGNVIRTPERLVELAKKNGATDAAAVVISPVLLQVNDSFLPQGLIGFDPEAGAGAIKLKDSMKYGKFSLERGEILLNYVVADNYNIQVGDKVLLHAPSRLSQLIRKGADGKYHMAENAEIYLPSEFTVSGIFSFGKYDFDKQMLFLNLEDADDLFGLPLGAATQVYLWTSDPFNMGAFQEKMNKELKEKAPDCYLVSWQKLHERFLGVLAVEKNMQFFLLVFIVLVAAFSITNTLITTVIQKTKEIGLLKSMGAGAGTILRIFLLQGAFVGVLGTSFGVGLGFLIIRYRMQILQVIRICTGQEIFPKEFYLFNELPAHIVGSDVCTIAVISVLLCTCGAVIPAFRAAKLDPARALRYE